jgi:hypothetical protein
MPNPILVAFAAQVGQRLLDSPEPQPLQIPQLANTPRTRSSTFAQQPPVQFQQQPQESGSGFDVEQLLQSLFSGGASQFQKQSAGPIGSLLKFGQ